jgi:hypothetical protein
MVRVHAVKIDGDGILPPAVVAFIAVRTILSAFVVLGVEEFCIQQETLN